MLLEHFYDFESPTPNRLAYGNSDYVPEQRRRMPMVKLMPNMPETENTLLKTDNALGLRLNLFGKQPGVVYQWDKGFNTCYYINPWFQKEENCTQIFGACLQTFEPKPNDITQWSSELMRRT